MILHLAQTMIRLLLLCAHVGLYSNGGRKDAARADDKWFKQALCSSVAHNNLGLRHWSALVDDTEMEFRICRAQRQRLMEDNSKEAVQLLQQWQIHR